MYHSTVLNETETASKGSKILNHILSVIVMLKCVIYDRKKELGRVC